MEALVTYTFFSGALTYVVVKSHFHDVQKICRTKARLMNKGRKFLKKRFELIQDYLDL